MTARQLIASWFETYVVEDDTHVRSVIISFAEWELAVNLWNLGSPPSKDHPTYLCYTQRIPPTTGMLK